MDFDALIGETQREVQKSAREDKPTYIVRAQRFYATTPMDLWNAITERKRIQRWFGEVSGDLKDGGHFSIKGNASGEILSCKPPQSFALTWEFGEGKSWVSIGIESIDEGAKLTLEHEVPADAHWEQYGPGATGVGWEWGMLGLDGHLINPDKSLIDEGMAWAAGDSGKAALRNWAIAWGHAHEKAGASKQTALEAAERTAAFYTGEA